MKELQLNYEYKEHPGVTHGPIIAASMPDIYAFFAKHSKHQHAASERCLGVPARTAGHGCGAREFPCSAT